MPLARTRTGSVTPSKALQRATKAAIEKDGEKAVVERLGVSRSAVAALAAGLSVRRGTAALAAIHLGLDAAEESSEK